MRHAVKLGAGEAVCCRNTLRRICPCCRSQTLEVLPVRGLWTPGEHACYRIWVLEGRHASGTRPAEHTAGVRNLLQTIAKKAQRTRKENSILYQCPSSILYWQSFTVPADKGEIFKGPLSILVEQTMKLGFGAKDNTMIRVAHCVIAML